MKANIRATFFGNLIEAQLWAIHSSHSVQRWECYHLNVIVGVADTLPYIPTDKVVTSLRRKHLKLLHLNTLNPRYRVQRTM